MTTNLRLPGRPEELTLPALLARNATEHPALPALSWREEDGWTTLTWGEVRHEVAVLAAGYAVLGVERGDHVLLMMGNRPEHWLTDQALVHLGAVPVTVYGTSAPEQIAHIARHSRARLAVVEGAGERDRWAPLLDDPATPLERLVVADAAEAGPHTAYGSVRASGARLHRPDDFDDFDKAWQETRPEDPLTVVYTSGTTGDPKGVRLTHRNILLQSVRLDRGVTLPEHAEHVCYLPFAHIAERILGIYLPLLRAAHVRLVADPTAVAAAVRELRPVQFFGVPRVWEKLAAGVRAVLAGLPEEQRRAIDDAGDLARARAGHQERGEEVPAALEASYAGAKERVLDPLLRLAGLDRLVWTASATAPMPIDVVRFWAGWGITIMDAWGLTETSGVCTVNSNTPDGFRLGSVGRPIEGLELKVAGDGEILTRGATVFDGYLCPDGSVESAADAEGWFPTGDVGRIDGDGFLWLTDRKKELIITSNGKNVSPALVENTVKEHPLIGQALVHGDGRSYLVALLVLDPELAPAWAAARGITAASLTELAEHPAVREETARAVAAANARLNRTEQIKRYRLLAEEWGPATGELTPSLKLRRRVVREKYGPLIEGLYEDPQPTA
ncbi:AMP-dependent synthetase/ligase [Streptomyces sp. NPDC090077]|uniref:AMP-dependent synthetase/ligase n=1 Tax=Streptomyces sp. NPDC090077 TaxID=3365938 RepID=UPI0038183E8B